MDDLVNGLRGWKDEFRQHIEAAERLLALEAALLALVYQDHDTKRWRTTKHGDYDVTDIVGAVLRDH